MAKSLTALFSPTYKYVDIHVQTRTDAHRHAQTNLLHKTSKQNEQAELSSALEFDELAELRLTPAAGQDWAGQGWGHRQRGKHWAGGGRAERGKRLSQAARTAQRATVIELFHYDNAT